MLGWRGLVGGFLDVSRKPRVVGAIYDFAVKATFCQP